MAWFLEDMQFVSHEHLPSSVHAWHVAGKRGKVTVLSTIPGQTVAFRLPVNKASKYFDLFGNPIKHGSPMGQTLVYVVH